MPDKLLCKCSLIKGSSSHATLGRDVTSANSYLWHSFWRFGYHPCGFQIAHAEQVTDLPPVFLHIAWELILAWGREDDSLQEGCWEQTTEKGVKKEMRKEEVKNSNSGWKALANETKSEYNVRNAFFFPFKSLSLCMTMLFNFPLCRRSARHVLYKRNM